MTSSEGEGRPGGGFRRGDALALAVAVLLVGACLELARQPDPVDSYSFPSHEYYPLIVEGWLQGRLDLPMAPPAGLLDLADPYDPVANEAFRLAGAEGLHDLTLHEGRLYAYWGPSPALVAFLPWRLLTGEGLDTSWAVAGFLFLGWFFSAVLVTRIGRRFFAAPAGVLLAAAIALGVTNLSWALLQRATVYEVAICAAYAFVSLTWWLLAEACWRPVEGRTSLLAAAGVAFALAVAARPIWLVAAPVLLVPLLPLGQWRLDPGAALRLVARAVVPVSVAIVVLLGLNVARFGAPLDFGMDLQLSAQRPPDEAFALRHLPFSLWQYLAIPPSVEDYFPFLDQSPVVGLPEGNRGSENVFGLLPTFPLLLFALAAPLLRKHDGLARPLAAYGAGLVAVFLPLGMLLGVALRYQLALAPTLGVLAVVTYLHLEWRWQDRRHRLHGLRGTALALLLVSFVAGFLVACSQGAWRDSTAIRWVARQANGAAFAVGLSTDEVIEQVNLQLLLSPQAPPPDREEVLLATGRHPKVNVLYLRRPQADRVVVGFHYSGPERFESEPFLIDPGFTQDVRVRLGSFLPPPEHPVWDRVERSESARARSRLRVEWGNRLLLDLHVPQWPPSDDTPTFGDMPRGSAGRRTFTGGIVDTSYVLRPLR